MNTHQEEQIENMKQALNAIIENDKTQYGHHQPRPNGDMPEKTGGTIWMTPREIARSALKDLE
jgi:hypothetical protein